MTPQLLWRGMLAGVIAALFAFVFARVFAEPQVDQAIAYEAAHRQVEMAHMAHDAGFAAVGAYVALVSVAQALLPRINEMPGDFPAVVLWNFRVASLGMQALLWTVIGIGFGVLAKRVIQRF